MRKLDTKTRTSIIRLLIEGNSIRATSCIADVSKNTVNKLLIDAGKACAKYHNENVRSIKASVIQCDEIWSFTCAKQKNVKTATGAPESAGNAWTWIAIDNDSKLIVSYRVSDRDSKHVIEFINDLQNRLANRLQLATNGHKTHLKAVGGSFANDMDYAMRIKVFGNKDSKTAVHKYLPSENSGIKKHPIEDNPDKTLINTSNVERQNLRMLSFTRQTNDFIKKIEDHMYSIALHFMYYNFVKMHETLQATPAMKAGLANRLWDISDLVAIIDANEKAPKKRGSYKKRHPKTQNDPLPK
jgi:IS1 family transposase